MFFSFAFYLFKSKRKFIIFSFCLISILFGFLVYQINEIKISDNKLNDYNDQGKVILEGVVSDEPELREESTKIEAEVLEISGKKISGKILITLGHYCDINYGDRVLIKGELKNPPNFEDFNYKKYLAKEKIYSVAYHPKVEKIAEGEGNFLFSKIYHLKEKMRKVINNNLSPPQSYILSSLILGDKNRMPDELKEKLNVSGLRHITAISGMHIVIISSALMSLLISIGIHRSYSFYLTIIFLALFILMIGIPASALRAGIMVGFLLLAQKLGRNSSSLRVIIFTAAGILLFNPLFLRYDVGFQLSFLAVTGIIILTPFFENLFYKVFKNNFSGLFKIISMTISAQIFVFPLLIYNFGGFSLVTIFTNILVLPILPFLVGFGFLFILTGIVFPFFGWIISWICWIFLTYIVLVIDFFYNLPFAFFKINEMSLSLLFVSYSFLLFIFWKIKKNGKVSFLSY